MESKRNLKYFVSKGINPVLCVGAAIVLIGLILMLGETTSSFGLVIALVGVGVAVFATGAKSGEADIDNQILGIVKDLPEQAQIRHEVYERSFLAIVKPVLLKGFDFRKEGIYCKKCPDHKYRTSDFNAAQIYFTREKVYVYGKHICLIDSSEEANYEIIGSCAWEDLKEARIDESEYTLADGRKIAVHSFVLETKAGEKLIDFSVEYGADVDKAADDINHAIEKMTLRAMEKAADRAAKHAALKGQEMKYE